MSIACITQSLQDSLRQINNLTSVEAILLRTKNVGYGEEVTLTTGFYPYQKKDKTTGTNVLHIQFSSSSVSFDTVNKCSHLVFRNWNPIINGRLFQMLKETVMPLSQSLWIIPLSPTGEIYQPE